MMARRDYPVGHIRQLMANYGELSEGKSDIDEAIDSLDNIEREIVLKIDIEKCSTVDLERKFEGLNIWQIEHQAIRNMAGHLNGECVFERWCRENGMVSKGNLYMPAYLPEEIQQYLKDICLKYCVLDECP